MIYSVAHFHGKIDVLDQPRLCVTSRRIVWFGRFYVLSEINKMAKLSIERLCSLADFP